MLPRPTPLTMDTRQMQAGFAAERKELRQRAAAPHTELSRMKGLLLQDCEEHELVSLLRELKLSMERVGARLRRKRAETAVEETMPWALCPIGFRIMRDPVQCSDGQTYSRAAIERWLATHNTSPVTKLVLECRALTPNDMLASAIEEAVQSAMQKLAE